MCDLNCFFFFEIYIEKSSAMTYLFPELCLLMPNEDTVEIANIILLLILTHGIP